MDTKKLVYRDDLKPRQNFETLFNWVRFMMNEFDHGRTAYDVMADTKEKADGVVTLENAMCEADTVGAARMADIENAMCEQDGGNANG